MKKLIAFSGVLVLTGWFAGCYRQPHFENMVVPTGFKVVGLDDPVPSQDEADVIVSTHRKKASYLLSPRTADAPYTFTLLINGQEVEEEVKGVDYILKKRFRLKPGRYEITLKTEEGSSAKVKVKLDGGRIHDLMFEPIYGNPLRTRIMKIFVQGIKNYEVYLDGNRVSKE